MKKIEYLNGDSDIEDMFNKINEFVYVINELLETHTVKEENLCVNCKEKEAIVGMLCDFCRSEGWKEEPTTPEKKC